MRHERHALSHCPAASYPRTLSRVLSEADAAHLTRLFFKISTRFKLKYYGLLHLLAHQPQDEFAATLAVVRKLQARVEREFGPQFVFINDFYSYRREGKKLFPDLHQDYDFWYHPSRCSGFNLWVLLDERGGLNHSFDVYDVQRNRHLYDRLYARAGGTNATSTRSSIRHLEPSAFRELRERNAINGVTVTRVAALQLLQLRAVGSLDDALEM